MSIEAAELEVHVLVEGLWQPLNVWNLFRNNNPSVERVGQDKRVSDKNKCTKCGKEHQPANRFLLVSGVLQMSQERSIKECVPHQAEHV